MFFQHRFVAGPLAFAALLALVSLHPGCRRSREVAAARDAGSPWSGRTDLLCRELEDSCLLCAGKDNEAPLLDPDEVRPMLCEPKDPENCVEFCSSVTPDCAVPWRGEPTCVVDSELAYRRAVWNRETADRPEVVLAGRLVDEAGKRVESAKIRAWLGRGSVLTPLGDETSGKDGTFRLRLRTGPWTYTLRMSAPGLASEFVERLSTERIDSRPAAAPRVFRLGPETVIRGHVLSAATGSAVVGALVQAVRNPEDAVEVSEGHTGEDGAFTLSGLEGKRYTLRISRFGWRPQVVKAPVLAPTSRLTIKLLRSTVIRGVVLDADATGEPNALVIAVPSSAPGMANFPITWRSKTEGRFEQDRFAPGTYYVWARRRDMLVYPPTKIDLADGEEVEVKLALTHKGARLSGRALLKEEGPPQGRGRVVLVSRSPLAFPKPAVGDLDGEGNFSITGVLPGRYTLTLHSGARNMVIVSGPREVEIPIEPGSQVTLPEPLIVRAPLED